MKNADPLKYCPDFEVQLNRHLFNSSQKEAPAS
jgi:hypothetical protein